VRPSEEHDLEAITEKVMACIILHNMMVENRIENEQEENMGFYVETTEIQTEEETYDNADDVVAARSEMRARNLELNDEPSMEDTIDLQGLLNRRSLSIAHLSATMQSAHERWEALTNMDEHNRLKKAIMRHVDAQSKNKKKR
jgi:hypothetical protein